MELRNRDADGIKYMIEITARVEGDEVESWHVETSVLTFASGLKTSV